MSDYSDIWAGSEVPVSEDVVKDLLYGIESSYEMRWHAYTVMSPLSYMRMANLLDLYDGPVRKLRQPSGNSKQRRKAKRASYAR